MSQQTYAPEHLDIWHAVKHVDEFSRRVRGKCGYDFQLVSPPVTSRPRRNMCLGCVGAEAREKASLAGSTPPPCEKTERPATDGGKQQQAAADACLQKSAIKAGDIARGKRVP